MYGVWGDRGERLRLLGRGLLFFLLPRQQGPRCRSIFTVEKNR